jgi:D-beta-D-heptose 7-phosphate kinase/D-beta-D-heptose 1-phosphate adenosyltransferase
MKINRKLLESSIEAFATKHILVIGDIMLDHYVWGNVNRISPEAPVPIVEVQCETYLLGGASNVANNIVSLGAKASIIGTVGNDRHGVIILNLLSQKGINTQGVIIDDRPSTVKMRIIAHNQQIVRVDKEDSATAANSTLKKIQNYISDNIDKFDAIIVSDYNKGIITEELMKFLLSLRQNHDVFIAVDPRVEHFNFYKGVSLITPNKKEAQEGSGIFIHDEQSLEAAAKILMVRLDLKALLITRSHEGMSLFSEGSVHHIPTVAHEVYDVTGAGDTVIATFTLARSCSLDLFNSSIIANHAAGIVVGTVGTSTPTTEQLFESFKGKL